MWSRRLFTTTARAYKKAAFVFDIDGVLLRGGHAIPQARSALELCKNSQSPIMLLTNGGGKSEDERVSDLTNKLGFEIGISEFVQSHTPFKNLVSLYDKVLVVGGDGDKCRQVARSYGFTDVVTTQDIVRYNPSVWPFCRYTEQDLERYADPLSNFSGENGKIDAILVFNDPRDAGTDLQIVIDLLLSENGQLGTRKHRKYTEYQSKPSIPIHFSNNDLLWSSDYPIPRFGQGAFKLCVDTLYKQLTQASHLEATVIGKPFAYTYDFTWKAMRSAYPGTTGDNTVIYMVGDNPASDILGANNYGWQSLLVRTGVFQDSDLETGIVSMPTAIVNNVLEAVKFGLEKTN